MHIMEGYLPLSHAVAWTAITAPFVVLGVRALQRTLRENPEARLSLGAAGAFAFVLSALKLPSLTGSCSHPTGTGLGAILFGPLVMSVIALNVLLFQALLLAHGGLSTLGANTFSMGIVGPWVSYLAYQMVWRAGGSIGLAAFFAAALGDLATYTTTSAQLALAFPDAASGFVGAFWKFSAIFALTQIPLALSEGIVTLMLVNFLLAHNKPELLHLLSRGRS